MTEDRVTRVVAAEVTEASKAVQRDEDVWSLRLRVPFSQYPIPTSMPTRWAGDIRKGETHMVQLVRGRETGKGDGSKDFHYFWDVGEWDTQAVPTPAAAVDTDDRFRTKAELRWTEAINMALQWRHRDDIEPSNLLANAEWFDAQLAERDAALVARGGDQGNAQAAGSAEPVSTPAVSNNGQDSDHSASATITVEDAARLMNKAEQQGVARSAVMVRIKEQYGQEQPKELTRAEAVEVSAWIDEQVKDDLPF